MFGRTSKAVVAESAVKVEAPKKTFASAERAREYDIASKLGLKRQMRIIELEDKGYKVVQGDKVQSLFDMKPGEEIVYRNAYEFTGKIPFGALCKMNEELEHGVFTDLVIAYPSRNHDPVLLGKIYYEQGPDLYFILSQWE